MQSYATDLCSECLLICSSGFSGATDWRQLQSEAAHRVTVFWADQFGRMSEITTDAVLIFVPDQERKFNLNLMDDVRLPVAIDEFSKKMCPVMLSLGSRDAYRRLLQQMPPAQARRLLLQANDVAALHAFKPRRSEYLAARKDGFLERHLLHSDEQRFTLIALPHLLEEAREPLQSGTPLHRLRADLDVAPGFKLEVDFLFGDMFGQKSPINVVIGPNGAGKTRMLLGIAAQALDGTLQIQASAAEGEGYDGHSHRSPNIAAFTYETRHWSTFKRRGIPVTPLGISPQNWKLLTRMLQQVATNTEVSRFDLQALLQVLHKVLDTEDIYLPAAADAPHVIQLEGQPAIPFSELVAYPERDVIAKIDIGRPLLIHNAERGFYELSSGQKSLFYFSTALFLQAGRGSLLLIDEPENHLHPQFITLLMQTLASSLIAKEAKAIVVTHSPFVVREVDKNAVLVLQPGPQGLPAIYRPTLQTFGADVSMISDYVFGDVNIRKGYESLIDDAIGSAGKLQPPGLLSTLNQSLGNDAMNYLQNKMRGDADA